MRIAGRIYARRMTRRDGWMFGPWTIHCSPAGNDTTGDGTYLNPYFSPGKAATIMHDTTGGYTCFCRGGTYALTTEAQLSLHVGVSGSAAAPFVFREFPGERPKLSYSDGALLAGINMLQSTFIHVRGFEVLLGGAVQGATIQESSDCILEACEIWSASPAAGQIGVQVQSRPTASGGATDRNTIRDNHFHDLGQEAMYVKKWLDNADSVDANIFERNLVTGSMLGETFQNTNNLAGKPLPSNTVFRNNVTRATMSGAGNEGAAHIQYNGTIIDGNIWIGSGGSVGCLTGSLTAASLLPSFIRNNLIIWSVNTAASAGGIYISDGNASGTLNMYHNTIVGFTNPGAGNGFGMYLHDKPGTYNIKNNIVASCDFRQIQVGETPGTIDADYNNVYGTTGITGDNAQTGDPAFADSTEYRLSAASPGLSSGLGGLVAYDLNRRPRDATNPDMGCHEYS